MPRRLVLALLMALAPSSACAAASGAPDAASDAPHAHDAPEAAPPACPLFLPTPGAPCALPPSFACSFGDPCSFDRFACHNGAWAEVIQDGAVPETCPEAAPSTGSTCASCGNSYRCVYDASCASTTSICSGGHWLTGTTPGDCGAATDSQGGPG
jgi:hypothetical protein